MLLAEGVGTVPHLHRVLGWLLATVGVLLVVAGIACAVVVGDDSAVSSGTHRLTSDGSTIVTADGALDHAGPTVRLTVSTPDGEPVFVGIANAVDVADYLAGAPVTQVDSFSLPWEVSTTTVEGDAAPAADPRDLDWWLVSDSGDGSASIDFPLPDDVVDVVIMDPDRGREFAADVTVAIEVPGLFAGSVAAAVFGVGLVLGAVVLLRRRRSVPEPLAPTARDRAADIGAP
jgi:hypothetical protein